MNIYKYEDIKEQLLDLMIKKMLVPVLGAGFTRNEKTKKGVMVPDGEHFKIAMINELIKHQSLSSLQGELNQYNFNQVSNYFFNEEFVTLENRKEILRKYFLDVKLPYNKRKFLDKDVWPYIYTFNIDDAIETNSKYRAVLPYKKLDVSSRDAGCVYKIHGDVFHEITYEETSTLIFSEPQYVASLMKNQSMLNFLKSDLFDNNLMFIGCSLENEIDLMYALSTNADDYNTGALRILVTRKIPSNTLEEYNYKQYGINTIIQVDDYNVFYNEINQLINEAMRDNEEDDLLNIYKIDSIKNIAKSKDANLEYLLQNTNNYVANNQLLKPDFIIERNILDEILESINKNQITVIKGRRFSGKSYLALNIAEKNKQKNFYYFPSTMKIDKETLIKLFEYNNSLIFFDSNVLDQELAFFINNSIENLRKHNTSIVIICNNMEIDIANTFLHQEYSYEFYYEISNRFNENELQVVNNNLSKLGIIEFKDKSTLLDNIYSLRKIYADKTLYSQINNISYQEAQVLIILSVFDKIYTPVCIALGMNTSDWNKFVDKFTPLVELVETSFAEREQHSRFKIVVNSKVWLNQLLKDYHWNITQTEILSNIKTIIKTFKHHGQYKLIQQRVMMLDSLNGIMGKDGGSYKLMRYIYENLQEQLSDSPDYWLQRAKVIYKLEKYSIGSVEDAIDFAKKAYHDSNRTRTINNAEFMVALLYGKLSIMQKFNNINNIINTIEWFYKAIKTHEYNKDYVNSMLENKKAQKGTFVTFCKYLDMGSKPPKILIMKNEISAILNYNK